MLHDVGKGSVRAVHRTRVASRRLRELVPVLQLDAKSATALGRRLRKITQRLGAVRELDVIILLLDELHESSRYDRDTLAPLSAQLAEQRATARKRLLARLSLPDLKRVASKLGKIADELADGDRKHGGRARGWRWAIEARASRRAVTLKADIVDAGAVYLPERLHRVRIALKKFRYALELRNEVNDRFTPELKALKKSQDVLGRLHDRQVLIDRVRKTQASIAPPDVGAWRRLDALQTAIEKDCRRLHARYLRDTSFLAILCDRVVERSPASAAPWGRSSKQARRAG